MSTAVESLIAAWQRRALREMAAADAAIAGSTQADTATARAQVLASCARALAEALTQAPTTQIRRAPQAPAGG